MTSIYCDHIESECFNFSNCMKCKYSPSTFVPEKQAHRIAQDAALAIEALEAIRLSEGALHQDYLKEKLSIVERCALFMSFFVKDGDTNG